MKKILPPVYFFFSILLMAGLQYGLPIRKMFAYPGALLGILPLCFGISLVILGANRFARRGTPIKPFRESSALVTDGPYRFTRNPMYLGLNLGLIGIATLMGGLSPWFVIPFFAALLDIVFIREEERMMKRIFGEEYLQYKRQARRWF